MYVNGKMILVETVLGIEARVIKENDGGSKFKYDIFDITTFINVTMYSHSAQQFKKICVVFGIRVEVFIYFRILFTWSKNKGGFLFFVGKLLKLQLLGTDFFMFLIGQVISPIYHILFTSIY
jgi:hypothetical protein